MLRCGYTIPIIHESKELPAKHDCPASCCRRTHRASRQSESCSRLWRGNYGRFDCLSPGEAGSEGHDPGKGTARRRRDAELLAWLNAGGKRPRSYYELNLLGMAGWRRLQTEIGPELRVQWGGGVEWFPPGTEAEDLLKGAHERQQWGYSTRIIDEAEVRHLLPKVTPGEVAAACYYDLEGTVDPVEALGVLLKKVKALGATVEYPCECTGLDLAVDRIRGVQTTRGKIEADAVILANGVGTPKLAAMADWNVPLVESPGVLAHTVAHTSLLNRVALAPHANIKQNPDGRFVTGENFGGTPGVLPTREVGERLLETATHFLPNLKGVALEYVTLGHRVLPKDGHPIIGFSAKYSNLYVAAMHSGMTLSPVIGQLVAMEILDGASVDLLDPFRPSRFAGLPA
jgi:glycine/D-amino acid oxidase-like deaminating enzyme